MCLLVIGTKVVGTLTSSRARLEGVVLRVSSEDESGETIIGTDAAKESEVADSVRVVRPSTSTAGGAGRGGSVGGRLSAGGDGRRVGELSGGKLGSCQVAHGEGKYLSVTHLGWVLFSVL